MSIRIICIAFLLLLFIPGCKQSQKQSGEDDVDQRYSLIRQSLIEKFDPDTNWHQSLIGNDSYRYAPIMTIELEKAWLIDRPILFEGYIRDLRSYNEHDYLVDFGFPAFTPEYFALRRIYLKTIFPKTKIDSLLNEHPNILSDYNYGLIRNIIIISRIDSITTTSEVDQGIIQIGVGKGYEIVKFE